MAFTVAYLASKRLRMIDASGQLVLEEPSQGDVSYLQLLENKPAQTAALEDTRPAPEPEEVLRIFHTALGELQVAIDVLRNVLGQQYLDTKLLPARRSDRLLHEKVVENSGRVGFKQAALLASAATLRQGLHTLQALAAQEDAFYSQVSQLQKFWKVRLNAGLPQCPYLVDLALADDPTVPSSTPDTSSDTYDRQQLGRIVPLVRGRAGSLHVQVLNTPPGAPTVEADTTTGSIHRVKGAAAVHQLLLDLQRQLTWTSINNSLQNEFLTASHVSSHAASLAKLATMSLQSTHNSQLASLRPLMLHHHASCYLTPLLTASMPRPYTPAPQSQQLLPMLAGELGQLLSRGLFHRQLEEQAYHVCPRLKLHWQGTTDLASSALQLDLGCSRQPLLAMFKDSNAMVLEGMLHRLAASRQPRNAHRSVSLQEVYQVLNILLGSVD